jgi:peptide/nickel transport system permease protein
MSVRLRYLGRKVVWLVATLYGVVTFNFLLFHVLPGNPVRLLARSGHLTPQAVADITRVYGLNHPLGEQYLIYLLGLLRGQLGLSYTYREPVGTLLGQYLGNTVLLLAGATVLTIIGGVLAGVVAANRRGGAYDSTTVTTSVIGWALPTFWTGLILAFVLGVWLRAFPIFGMQTPNAVYPSAFVRAEDISAHLFLPTLTLVIVNIAQFVLVARASVIEVLAEDFMLTATAKGLAPRRILWQHAVRNALLPIVTSSALLIGLVVAGAIEVETVFSWPGMGLLVYNAVLNRDYPVIEGAFLVFAVVVLLVNFASDLLYSWLDPRVRAA